MQFFLAISASNNNNKNSDALKVSQNFTYEIFSQELLDKYLENNERVFVNMTADWCLTCKVKRTNCTINKSRKKSFQG